MPDYAKFGDDSFQGEKGFICRKDHDFIGDRDARIAVIDRAARLYRIGELLPTVLGWKLAKNYEYWKGFFDSRVKYTNSCVENYFDGQTRNHDEIFKKSNDMQRAGSLFFLRTFAK